MGRRLRPALELVSDIGSLGFDLQHHSDEQIRQAVTLVRAVNPELFMGTLSATAQSVFGGVAWLIPSHASRS